MSQLTLDLAPAPTWKPLRREQARVLWVLHLLSTGTPWQITERIEEGFGSEGFGVRRYERGCTASRLSELAAVGVVEVCGSAPSPVKPSVSESVYRVAPLGQARLDEARLLVAGEGQ